MDCVSDLIQLLEQKRRAGDIGAYINGSHIQIYESSPLQFNVTLTGCRHPAIKGEMRSPAKLTIAVSPKDGESIDYTDGCVFPMCKPLENLIPAFPGNPYIRQFVDCLTSSTPAV